MCHIEIFKKTIKVDFFFRNSGQTKGEYIVFNVQTKRSFYVTDWFIEYKIYILKMT